MSRFYASIQGSRGEATRQGTPKSGIAGHIRGWSVGVRVSGEPRNDSDCFDVYATHGSNGSGRETYLGTVKRDNDSGEVYFDQPDGAR